MKAIAGSHLFGTNTETSDMDYKGVFVPTREEILLGNYSDTRSSSTGDSDSKNSSNDTDIELYSLRKFFKMVHNGDTAAIELLYTPKEMIIESTSIWDEIVEQREQLISKKMNSLIGYARHQANKYGIKGSRMGELSNIMSDLKALDNSLNFKDTKLKHTWSEVLEVSKKYNFMNIIELKTDTSDKGKTFPAVEILGKKFDYHNKFSHVLPILKKIYKNYGQRAREAKNNNGIDWKALSHAVRVMIQGQDLVKNGKITLPHTGSKKELIMNIKKGNMEFSKVSKLLEDQLELLEDLSKKSNIRDKVDQKLTDDFIIKTYTKVINGNI